MSSKYYELGVELTKHFNSREFSYPGCRKVLLDKALVKKLEKFFDFEAITRVVITSGYRSPEYSVQVGGSSTDAHTKGLAADIVVYQSGKAISSKYVSCMAQIIGFTGIGIIDETAVHVDIRTAKTYANGHWFGDERNHNDSVNNFFDYCDVDKLNMFGEFKYYKEKCGVLKAVKKSPIRKGPSKCANIKKYYKVGKKAYYFARVDGWYKTKSGWIYKSNIQILK